MALLKLLIACALVSFLPSSLSQSNNRNNTLPSLMCPENSTVSVETGQCGQIRFASLPGGSPLRTTDEYNPGGLSLWYNLASGVIDAAIPGGLPYDIINSALAPVYPTLVGGSNNANPDEDALGTVARQLGLYFAGLIALTVIGGLIGICMPVCGCCFCCCRLCGFCGGNLKQKDTKYNDCLMWVFTIILVLLTCGLAVGVIFSFLSNQQVFNSLQNIQTTTNNALQDASTFIDNSVDEINFLFCQFNDTVDVGIGEVQTRVDETLNTIDRFGGQVNDVVNSVNSLSQEFESTRQTLNSIQTDIDTLRTTSLTRLQGNLTQIADELDILQTNCSMSGLSCPDLNANMFRMAVNIDLNNVPNVTQEIQNINDVLMGVDLNALARQGNETFNNLTMNLRAQVSRALQAIQSNSSQLSTGIDQIRTRVNPLLSTFTSSNVTSMAMNIVRTAFESYVRPYDTARYALGIVICSLSAVVVIVIFAGVLCGAIGFRRNREPDDRTSLSNCGGITLLFAVALAFIFGCLLLILSALTFFAGGIFQKMCQAIEPPQYELFAQTLDNPNNTNGQYLLGRLIFQNGSVPVTISGILNNCSNNGSVYQVLMLNRLLNLQAIRSDISQRIPNLQGDLSQLTSGFTFGNDSILPSDLRMRLMDFTGSGVGNINFTAYQEELDRSLLSVDLDQQTVQLTNVSNTALSAINSSTPAKLNETLMSISDSALRIIGLINDVNTTANSIRQQVNMLSMRVNDLNGTADRVTTATTNTINSADNLVEQVNGPDGIQRINMTLITTYDCVLGYVNSYLDHVVETVETQVGNCDVVPVIYTGAYNSVCRFARDGLNGFWLALGWCGIFFLPIIIFAILAQQYYRKMKVEDDFPHDDSFPLKTY